ncbi:MAG: DUF1330 domain-containing protein [Pseudomonadota bacterium]
MAYGYVIAQINVTDPQVYPRYKEMVQPTLDLFGGVFLVRGGQAEHFEGKPAGDRMVVIRFPSYQAALDWYHSEAYAEARALRQSASTSVQTIVEGI